MTLAEKFLELFGKEYNDMELDQLNLCIKEIKPNDLSKAFDNSYTIDCLHNHFAVQTIGVMVYKEIKNNPICIKFEDDLYDTLEEFNDRPLFEA